LAPTTSSEVRDPELTFREITFQFKFAFDVGQDINPVDAANRLLDTDMAVAAVWQGEAWEASRFQGLKEHRRLWEQLQEAQSRVDEGFWHFIRYIAVRPKLFRMYLSSLLKDRGRADQDEEGEASHSDVAGVPDDAEASTAANFFDEMDAAVAHTSSLQKLLELVDHDLFNPDFLSEGPWLRVELQPVFLTVGEEHHAVDVWLLLHKTGNATMTFSIFEDGPMTPANVSRSSMAGFARFNASELSTWIVSTSALMYEGWEYMEPQDVRFSSGIEWGTWIHDEPASLVDVFGLYQDALIAALSAGGNEVGRSYATQWTCYPVISVRDADARTFDPGDDNAQEQIGALLARVGDGKWFHAESMRGFAANDLSIRSDRRSWINGGLALTIVNPHRRAEMAARYGSASQIPGQDWIWLEQQFAVPIDFLLLQYHAAHALLAQVANVPMAAEALHTLKARVLFAKKELWRASHFAFGTLYEFAEAFHAERFTGQTWALVDEGLDLVDSVLGAELGASAERRAFRLQAVLGMAALVLGIPAIYEIVQILGGIEVAPSDVWLGAGGLVSAVSSFAAGHPAFLVLSLAMLLTGLVLGSLLSRTRRPSQLSPLTSRVAGGVPRKRPAGYFEPGSGPTWVLNRED